MSEKVRGLIGADRDELLRCADAALAQGGAAWTVVVVRLRKLAAIAQLHGTHAAAHLLDEVTARIRGLAGAGQPLALLDEGTFGLIVAGDERAAQEAAERIIAAASRPVAFGEASLYAPANAGGCLFDPAVGDAAAHLERAMRALQRAMARGPGTVELVSGATIERAVEEWEMRSLLEEAGLRGELSLEYQPVQPAGDGPVRMAEALMRWDSPMLGRVSPARFIPLLEDSGLIRSVGEWSLRMVAEQVREWHAAGLALRVGVNVSPIQLAAGDFPDTARRVLAEAGCEARSIELEVTEGTVIRDFAQARAQLEALAQMGFTLAIDDFGVGYSSLGQLAQLPVHRLKMDGSLIAELPDSPRCARVVKAVLALADALGAAVTAEGVERPEQAEWLRRFPGIGCQGYLFFRPLPAREVSAALAARPAGS